MDRVPAALATAAIVFAVPLQAARQDSTAPVIAPFKRAPSPFVVIDVPVAGAGCVPLIFDTGTRTTVLTRELAARVGLATGPAAELHSLTGPARAIHGEVHGIGFEHVPTVGKRTALAANVGGLRGFGRSVAGLYGHNWLTGADYVVDYAARRVVIWPAGASGAPAGAHYAPLNWAEGRPAVTAIVRAPTLEPYTATFVLDSGAEHVTLFGAAARRLAHAADWDHLLRFDSGFGAREEPTARIHVNVGGRDRSVRAALWSGVQDRLEDGLLPTSLFRSVFVSSSEGVVVFDADVSASSRM